MGGDIPKIKNEQPLEYRTIPYIVTLCWTSGILFLSFFSIFGSSEGCIIYGYTSLTAFFCWSYLTYNSLCQFPHSYLATYGLTPWFSGNVLNSIIGGVVLSFWLIIPISAIIA